MATQGTDEKNRLHLATLENCQAIARVGGWEVDLVRHEVFWTDEIYRILETSPEEYTPSLAEDGSFFTPESQLRVQASIEQAMATGEPYDLELQVRTHKGRLLWVRAQANAVRENGQTVRLYGAFQDITERKTMELALRASEERYRAFMDHSPVVAWMVDDQDRFIYISARYTEVLGIHPDRALGRSLREVFAPEIAETFIENNRKVLREQRPIQTVEPVPLANGKIRQYLSHKFPVPTPEGRFCLGGFAVDITERQEFEEKIQAERNLLQRLIDSVPDYIFVKDRQSRYILLNQAVAQIFNLTDVSAGLGQLDDRFFPKDVAERYREEDRRVMESGIATYDREDTVVNAAGETRWCLTSKIPLRDAEGKIVGLIGLVRDVTEKRGLEHQFLRSQRLESIGMLAGGIAHDLNNVFAPIILGLDLLKEREGQDKEILDSISASSLRGAALVSQILSFARGMEGPRVSVSPWKLVQDVAKIARETFPRNIRVEVEGTADGWTLAGDPTQLHQVLMNLAVNARDAMLQGGTLKLRLSNVSSDGLEMERVGEFVKIEIADTGVGIPAPIRERIFEPFFTTKEPGKGTGLGLSTVKTIVKNHQGHLEMWSETGQGTQIFVYLPAEKKITPAAALSDRLSPRRGRGELILLVDDEVSIQAITGHALEASGYRVRLASDGAAALTEYAQYGSEIEVVITDMIMPVMDGAELIRALRQLNPKVRILASSGLTDAANLKRLAEAGVRHFITKPYEAKTLLQKLEEVLDEKQSN